MTHTPDSGQGPPPESPPPASPPPAAPLQPSAAPGEMAPTSDERTWAMLAHLAALAGYLIPLGSILGPLIVYLTKKDQSAYVARHARESLNFQITVLLAVLACIPLAFICVGIPLLIAIAIADLVLVIIAGIKANEGVMYEYPWCLRLIK